MSSGEHGMWCVVLCCDVLVIYPCVVWLDVSCGFVILDEASTKKSRQCSAGEGEVRGRNRNRALLEPSTSCSCICTTNVRQPAERLLWSLTVVAGCSGWGVSSLNPSRDVTGENDPSRAPGGDQRCSLILSRGGGGSRGSEAKSVTHSTPSVPAIDMT